MPLSKPYSAYKAISFDIFGTVLDEQQGLMKWIAPLAEHLPRDSPFRATPFPYPKPASGEPLPSTHPLMSVVQKHEANHLSQDPAPLYEDAMRQTYLDTAAELGTPWQHAELETKAQQFSTSCGTWPAFPDSVEALRRLGRHGAGRKLIALSNVSNKGIQSILEGPLRGIDFDAVYTAENIGAYKPARKNFVYLVEGVEREFGVSKDDLLHVAHGVSSDQFPAEQMGIDHVWVDRGEDCWEGLNQGELHRLSLVPDLKTVADLAKV